jgi:hypothetical protein
VDDSIDGSVVIEVDELPDVVLSGVNRLAMFGRLVMLAICPGSET